MFHRKLKQSGLMFWLITVLLAGCATHEPALPSAQDIAQVSLIAEQNKVQRLKQVSLVNQWEISGKLGIRTVSDGASLILSWEQRGDFYTIALNTAFGQGVARIDGGLLGVSIDLSSQGTFTASSPEQLIFQQLGWEVPVSSLFYWVRGLPNPESDWFSVPYQAVFSVNGQLQSLEQDGWIIRYSQYQIQDGVDLPGKVVLSKEETKLTFIIRKWKIIRESPLVENPTVKNLEQSDAVNLSYFKLGILP